MLKSLFGRRGLAGAIATVARTGSRCVRVTWAEQRSSDDFHFVWLRHNCPQSRHHKTLEPIVNPAHIPAEISPLHCGIDGDSLVVHWNDGQLSRYPAEFLRKHAYGIEPGSEGPWKSEAGVTVPWEERSGQRFADVLEKWGLLVVTGGPKTPEDSFFIAEVLFGSKIVPTHFGVIEDLRVDNTTNKNTDQLGYTSSAVELHTDQVFLAEPPTMQMLHCIRPAEHGGESGFSDALTAASYLRTASPFDYHLLTTVPVRFHRKQKAFQSEFTAPIVSVDPSGRPKQVRLSYFTMAPLSAPHHLVPAWYAAYARFMALCDGPLFRYSFALKAGDFAVYDNYRMLHARTAFSGTARHLRGIYIDRDVVAAHLRRCGPSIRNLVPPSEGGAPLEK